MLEINGDIKQNLFYKILYIITNITYNFFGSFIKIKLLKYKPHLNEYFLEIINNTSSPSRILCDNLWSNINYSDICDILSDKLKIFDIGCGNGSYFFKMNFNKNKNLSSFTGIDKTSKFEWDSIEKRYSNVNFITDDAVNSDMHLNNHNLIISQSALEHIKYDEETLKNISNTLASNNYKSIQIHLVPASHTLFTYLFHGYRQYNLFRLMKIKRKLLKIKNTRLEIIALGGVRGMLTHLKFITFPIIFRKKDRRFIETEEYFNECIKSIEKDSTDKIIFSPEFYALVIYHNIEPKLSITKYFNKHK